MKTPYKLLDDHPASSLAFFLDVDGTLLDFADSPDGVSVDAELKQQIVDLAQSAQGALAFVSGRSIANIDTLFGLSELCAAGLHGLERRDASGARRDETFDAQALPAITEQVEVFAQANPGIIAESKGKTLAVHYRRRPELKQEVTALAREAVKQHPSMHLIEGNCVVEFKPTGISKALAVERFMTEAPFLGRHPVFIGDDVTDEDGFRAAIQLGGYAVKVGEGPTLAQYRLESPQAVKLFLQKCISS